MPHSRHCPSLDNLGRDYEVRDREGDQRRPAQKRTKMGRAAEYCDIMMVVRGAWCVVRSMDGGWKGGSVATS